MMNKKYLHEEEMVKREFDLENKRLNDELENLGKMTDELLKQKIKENEKNELILLGNTVANNELKWSLLLSRFKDEEQLAKDLLDERTQLNTRLLALNEDISNQASLERDNKYSLIEMKNNIQETQIQIEDNKNQLDALADENEKLRRANAKFDHDIQGLRYKIDELKQKVELNAILKDVDIDELKLLTQNNALVSNSISTLVTKWDQAYSRLQELEKSKEY
jgi:hypothetical protein